MEKKKHVFLIGLYDKDSHKQELSHSEFLSIIHDTVGDCLISDAYGYYTHADGSLVKEPSLKVEMEFKKDSDIPKFADILKRELNQETILYDVVKSNSVLL